MITAPFPIAVDRKLLKYLEREQLHVNVFDDNAKDRGSENAGPTAVGLIGSVRIPLHALARGTAVAGTYDIINANGETTGMVKIRIAWKLPLSLVDVAGPKGLSAESMRILEGRFDSERDGRIAWVSFLKFVLPSSDAMAVQARLRQILGRAKERE